MADPIDNIDITADLNGQDQDAVPFNGDSVPEHRQSDTPPVDVPKDQNAKPAGLRDILSDAFKAQTDVPQPDGVPKQPDANVPPPDAPDELVKVGERWHKKDGTFASKEEISAFEAAKAAPPGQAPQVAPPEWASKLTALEQQQLASLPAETRAFLERTMDEVSGRTAQFEEYGLIEQVIGPRRQAWANDGLTPAMAVQQLFALSDFAGTKPAEFVLWFADQNKLDLDQILDDRDAAQANGTVDPAYQGLQQEIMQLRNAINGMTSQTTAQQQAAAVALVDAFIDEKDEKGNLAHPYFMEVSGEIQRHAANIRHQQPYLGERDVLKAAYDFATYSNVEVRGKIQQDRAKALKDEAAAEAAKARQAGVSINGGPAGDAGRQPNNANRTLREELQHAYNQSTLQ